ncbi:MAG: hypothetical protein HY072_07890, partial [Deltaproteobacteria bacterium]|nr:hypothetical protein [Deltaproteobacteria bacterium]
IWGGEEAVRTYREKVPARTRLIVYGPKLSVALVSDRGLKNGGLVNLAQKCAEEISIWDQNACTAPQICYVEGQQNAKLFLDALEIALDKVKIPPGPVPLENAIEIQKLKSVFEIAEFKGQGALRESKCGLDWTLFLDYQTSLEPSPLHRTLRIVPVDSFDTVFEEFKKVRGYLQTVGLGVGELEEFSLAGSLKDCGALRIVPLGEMAKGEIDDPHDGAYDVSLLVNFVFHKMTLDFDPLDVLSDKARETLIDARLRVLIREARKSSYYGKILKDLCIEGLLDLEKIPILKRLDLENNMPPASEGLKTGDTSGGYVTRSGGTTGVPKFSYYDDHDWKEMIAHARRALVAGGLSKKDHVVNFMIAGDLYGSFISFDHVLTQIGVMQFPFSGKITAQLFIKVAQDFKINTAIGIPSFIIPFLREVKQHAPDFKIEKIIYAGTPLSTIDRQWLCESLGARRVVSIIGANDGGGMAFQCEHQSEYQAGGFHHLQHHLMDEYNYVEIVDNNGNLLPPENVGKILITSLKKFAYPLIRYEIGDQGKILASKCKCGRTSRILEFLGRADEVLCIGMLNIALGDLRKVLVSIPYSELQLLATTDVRGEKLVLNLEISNEEKTKLLAKHEILSQLDIEKLVFQHIVQQLPKIRDSLETKLLRLEIKIYLPGALKRNTTTGKLKSIIDERVF